MKRTRFSRNCLASSRGAYVRQSHFLYIQEQLAKRGIEARLEDIIEVSITIRVTRYYVRCFGKLIRVTEREAMMLGDVTIIKK